MVIWYSIAKHTPVTAKETSDIMLKKHWQGCARNISPMPRSGVLSRELFSPHSGRISTGAKRAAAAKTHSLMMAPISQKMLYQAAVWGSQMM